jgi:glucokinase
MILGIDVGGTSIKYGIFDNRYSLKEKSSVPTQGDLGPEQIINKIAGLINDFPHHYVGIGFPSVVSETGFVHIAPNLTNFKNIDLKNKLKGKTGRQISIDNDANCAALAELYLGHGKGKSNFIYATLGTGIGGAIIINSQLYHGDNMGAGEIGYSILNFDETRENQQTNRIGILEDYIGLPRILDYYEDLVGARNPSMEMISKYADDGDPISKKVLEYYGEKLGFGLGSIMNILDIKTVIIGGGISRCTDIMYQKLNQTLDNRLLPQLGKDYSIVKAKFLSDAGIYGAAILAGITQ